MCLATVGEDITLVTGNTGTEAGSDHSTRIENMKKIDIQLSICLLAMDIQVNSLQKQIAFSECVHKMCNK